MSLSGFFEVATVHCPVMPSLQVGIDNPPSGMAPSPMSAMFQVKGCGGNCLRTARELQILAAVNTEGWRVEAGWMGRSSYQSFCDANTLW